MKVHEYLTAKYRGPNWALSDAEAKVLGIPVPLLKGWVPMYRNDQVSHDQARELMSILLRQLRDSHSPRRRDTAQWGIEVLKLHYGKYVEVAPPAPRKSKAGRKKSKARTQRQQRLSVYSAHVNSDSFLESYEWRRLRMEALKKYGASCQCCGSTPRDGVKMHVDHIRPRKLYPQLALSLDNLQVLCEVCNHGKGNWDMTDWRPGFRHVTELAQPQITRIVELSEKQDGTKGS